MKFTKMTVTGQLDAAGADRFARRIAVAYVLAALGITAAGLGGLIAAIRWW
ncbi:hypothetical protein CTTA_3470 [Comamonas testosteroni]|jgi:hypothetical protein|uniref:Uncharacterized protein n=2 Tax=Comamonas TaxID=283 RepID=A0A1Y1J374_COMTE|nr:MULTISPECIES: hypothetical protein [Comamonas]BDR09596.1 hypothetical protein CTR2_R29340 [Comamonas thiooxydans]GEQ76465.1 hypothetical protein CTTA_3470 [Comamonas testosteroni]